jgi:hypothetical protein
MEFIKALKPKAIKQLNNAKFGTIFNNGTSELRQNKI